MPIVFGEEAYSVPQILDVCRRHGDKIRGTYVVHYSLGGGANNPYQGARLHRPPSLAKEDPHAIYPWEQILMAAANCAGSDYPMLADYWGIPFDALDVEFSAVFDPRGEFEGLDPKVPFPADSKPCYLGFTWKATITSDAPEADLRRIHERAMGRNMVLQALRAVPLKHELVVKRAVQASSRRR
jgi:hypothetical protein